QAARGRIERETNDRERALPQPVQRRLELLEKVLALARDDRVLEVSGAREAHDFFREVGLVHAEGPVDETLLRRGGELVVLDVTDHAPLEDDVGADETRDDEDKGEARDDHPQAGRAMERARSGA